MTNPVSFNNNGWQLGAMAATPPNAVRLPGTPVQPQPPVQPPTQPPVQPPGWGNPFQSAYTIPIDYLADYPGAPSRLRALGISDSQKLLSWGRTPSGRWFLSHAIAVFANSQERKFIDNKVGQWVGQADLMRVGADHPTAILMQMTGIYDASYLRFYANSIDQFQLYTALQLKRLETGMPLISFQQLQQIIRNSMMSPPYVVWSYGQGNGWGPPRF